MPDETSDLTGPAVNTLGLGNLPYFTAIWLRRCDEIDSELKATLTNQARPGPLRGLSHNGSLGFCNPSRLIYLPSCPPRPIPTCRSAPISVVHTPRGCSETESARMSQNYNGTNNGFGQDSNGTSLSAFLTSLVTNVVIWAVEVSLFIILRTLFKRIYEPRSVLAAFPSTRALTDF